MKYAIDLDDTVFDFKYSFSLFCKVEYDIDFSENDLSYPHFITKKLGEQRARRLLKIFGDKDGYLNLKQIDGAIDAVKELSKNNEIYILTCRPSRFRKQTEKSLEMLSVFPKEVFIYEKIDKINICNSLNIDCIIEDNAKCCIEAQKRGIRFYLVNGTHNIFGKSVFVKTYSWPEILKEEGLLNAIRL
jgi:uncharacterized HAD superfamily protein